MYITIEFAYWYHGCCRENISQMHEEAYHLVAARLGRERAMVGMGWASSCSGCMDRLRKHYPHLVGGWFLARKVAWALNGCMATYSADYCMLVNEWAWSNAQVCLLRLRVNMDSVFKSELELK